MQLYFDPLTTSSRPVTFLLHDQGVPFVETTVNLHLGEHLRPEYLKLSPLGQVPLLDDDGFVLSECNAILKYVALKHRLPVYPAGLAAQARVDEMLSWFTTDFRTFHCAFGVYPRMLPALAHLDPATRADLAALAAKGSQRYLTALDGKLADGRPFVCGDDLSIADYAGLSQVTVAEFIDFDFRPYPNVALWIERMKARPGWNAAFAGFRGFVTAAANDRRKSPPV